MKSERFKIFQNNNKIFLIIRSWDTWQHMTCFHCSLKKSHPSCKQQYVYNESKDEDEFCRFFLSSKIRYHLRLVSMRLVQRNY